MRKTCGTWSLRELKGGHQLPKKKHKKTYEATETEAGLCRKEKQKGTLRLFPQKWPKDN